MFKLLVQPNAIVDRHGNELDFVFTTDPTHVPTDKIGIVCQEDTIDHLKSLFAQWQKPRIELLVETKDGWNKLDLDDILYFESFGPEITIHLANRSSLHIQEPLYQIESVLTTYQFARVSKSFIVNLKKIKGIQIAWNAKLLLDLGGSVQVEVTRSYVSDFKRRLGITKEDS